MLEILVYLFKNYMECDTQLCIPEEEATTTLRGAGYFKRDIQQALAWVSALNNPPPSAFHPEHTLVMRHYSVKEQCCLGKKGIAFLRYLQGNHIIDAPTRETIIERAMALWRSRIPFHYLKWVALMVLFNRKTDKKNIIWMQELVLHHRKTKAVH